MKNNRNANEDNIVTDEKKESCKRVHGKGYFIAASIFLFLGTLIFALMRWVFATFGGMGLTLSLLLFNMKLPMDGVSSSYVFDAILASLPLPIIIVAVALLLMLLPRQRKRFINLRLFGKERSIQVHPWDWLKRNYMRVSALVLAVALIFTAVRLDVFTYIYNIFDKSTLYEDYYVKPETAKITFPEKKRNLIYIFMESMENSYFTVEQGGVQDTCIAPELAQMIDENVSFSNTEKYGGATEYYGDRWTMAAMLAQTSGVTFNLPIEDNSAGSYSLFLPGAYSINQVLKDAGYNEMLMVGSDLSFGGRRLYFRQHGNPEVFDLYTARIEKKIPNDYFEWWGFEDQKLYTYAKEKITKLAQKDQPFAFTMLTVDTHHLDGYVCPLCGDEYDNQYYNVVACASKQVYEFVNWIKEQDFYENTTIVVTGDHMFMNPKLIEGLTEDYDRTVYNCFINAVATPTATKNRIFATFDMYPTTLAALGCEIEGQRLGLGTNLFSNMPTLAETIGKDKLKSELSKNSDYYRDELMFGIEQYATDESGTNEVSTGE